MGAIFDATATYRYTLWRAWEQGNSRLCFILLNPSTADATQNDPTIRRCLGFARSWGFASLEVVNLFAYRATDPLQLRQVQDPIGAENDQYLMQAIGRSQRTILAWGNRGTWKNRHQAVLELLSPNQAAYCLGLTQIGQPRHPLYTKSNIQPQRLAWRLEFATKA
ncbi:hypothetical protein BST81_01925 [Leptolyngbya sp. 'hensonii']|uniref:DUF1643 domain-containing protein n=1 Tax=Leptolyngbya sp. 'hensonii' TaxID=1922337 RepID=UPI00094FBC4B|nr:DUF1643 domain-containing protein [Leptolyngbya sp. 'hensonii']OLP20211.1 hypothetical protein BST81_01925 [Leptolyngbya sp. 'hensonii']